MTRRLLAALLGMLAVLMVPTPARAADHTVTLTTRGPSPSTITISVGDTVTFRAGDANTYHVRRSSGSWTFTATVTSGKPVTTKPFGAAGTYGYAMTFDTLIGESPTQSGSIVVPATQPTPSPTAGPSKTASPRPSATASARPSGSASPSVVPTPSGVAVTPMVGGVAPTPSATPSALPSPMVAPGVASPSSVPSSPVAQLDYANPAEIVQGSAHGFGLPAALAVVAALGVLTLIGRILLTAPEARPEVR